MYLHHTISREANRARITALHHQAQRDGLVLAARRARRHQPGHHMPKIPIPAALRVLTALGARTP